MGPWYRWFTQLVDKKMGPWHRWFTLLVDHRLGLGKDGLLCLQAIVGALAKMVCFAGRLYLGPWYRWFALLVDHSWGLGVDGLLCW